MDEKESSPVTGCLQLLLGFPVLILATNMAPQWRDFLLPLLPRNLSANAVSTIYGFSLLALILAGWTIITRVVDALFGTRLYPYYSKAERLPLGELAELRRRGILIIFGVFAFDELLKAAFGTAHPTAIVAGSPSIAPDAAAIVDSLGFLMFLLVWLRSQSKLELLALSLTLGGFASVIFDALVRNPFTMLQFRAFGLSAAFSFGEIAGIGGLILFGVTRFWDPTASVTPTEP